MDRLVLVEVADFVFFFEQLELWARVYFQGWLWPPGSECCLSAVGQSLFTFVGF